MLFVLRHLQGLTRVVGSLAPDAATRGRMAREVRLTAAEGSAAYRHACGLVREERGVSFDRPVFDLDRSVTIGRGEGAVGDEYDRERTLDVQRLKEIEHRLAGSGVEVSRRLVREEKAGFGDERACDRHPLLFAP